MEVKREWKREVGGGEGVGAGGELGAVSWSEGLKASDDKNET